MTGDEKRRQVGVMGLGRMGLPIAGHLVAAGFDVRGFDPQPDAGIGLDPRVARVDAPVDLAGCEVVLVLAGGSVVPSLLLEDDRLRPVWQDVDVLVCSTVDPAEMAHLHEVSARDGGRLLDAPLCRGDHGARVGDLLALVGGDSDVLDGCRDVLSAFCSDVVLVGGPGAGQTAKLVNNLLLWSTIASVTEALRLAEKLGVRRGPLVEGLLRSSAASWVLETWARPRELPWAHEDLRMVLESGARVDADLPVTEIIAAVIGEVRDSGALADGGFATSSWTLPAD